jgi:DNA polymerase I-like protein with 3'-5' exonuclease and polymerase domains
MLNTYVKNLEFYRQSDGRIHPTFWQTGARTGRFSSSNPNFQNYPKEDKRIRRCFVPTPGYTLVYFDYKAQEFRLLAHYANETRLIQMIEAGYDVHSATASLMFNIPIDEVTKVDRAKGKTGNFSAVYGIGNAAYASNLGDKIDTDAYKRAQTILAREGYKPWQMPTKDVILSRITDPLEIEDIEYIYAPETFKMINHAKDVKAKYFKELPNIKQFLDTTRKEVAAQGFIRLWSGRIKHYNDPKTEAYKGVNALIQGGCGDIMKSRLPQVAHLLKPTHSRLVNIIHDEIVVEVRNDELWLIPKIKDLMTIRDFKVTIDCDVELSTTNWAEKREWEDATEEAGIHQTA